MSLKQRIIKYSAMILGLLLAAMLITGAASVLLRLVDAFGKRKAEEVNYTGEFPADGIEGIAFNNRDGTMRIVTGDRFSVEGKNVPESFTAKIEKNILTVSYGKKEHLGLSLIGLDDFSGADITITVPEGFYPKTAELSNGSGKMFFGELNGGKFYVKNSSGKIELKEICAEHMEMENGSGSAILTQIAAEQVKMDQGSGSVSMGGVALGGFVLLSGSGDFELEGEINGNLSIDSGSGRVSFALKNRRKEYNIKSDTGSGALWLDGERLEDYSETNADAKHSITIDSGSGRVAIEFSGEGK